VGSPRLLIGVLFAVVSLSAAPWALGSTGLSDRVVGAEFPPITSTLGTFGGVATGPLPGVWRVEVHHQPLSSGAAVAITGGTFTMRTLTGRSIVASVSSGSVTVLDPGRGCTNQTYSITAALSGGGDFAGTLTHHRERVLRQCVIYAATVAGHATLTP
jgi:hypothetical protein